MIWYTIANTTGILVNSRQLGIGLGLRYTKYKINYIATTSPKLGQKTKLVRGNYQLYDIYNHFVEAWAQKQMALCSYVQNPRNKYAHGPWAVSYTHLTLPTILLV